MPRRSMFGVGKIIRVWSLFLPGYARFMAINGINGIKVSNSVLPFICQRGTLIMPSMTTVSSPLLPGAPS